MRVLVRLTAAALTLAFLAGRAAAQEIRIELHGALVTDRVSGVLSDGSARGAGASAAVRLRLGRLALDGSALVSNLGEPVLRREEGRSQSVRQFEIRFQFWAVPLVALQTSIVRRRIDPDPNGEEVGFVEAAIHSEIPLTNRAGVWGRLGYIPYARFAGSGAAGFSAEVAMGFRFMISSRFAAVGEYQFQRIDRRVESPQDKFPVTSAIQFDIARVGVAWKLSSHRPH